MIPRILQWDPWYSLLIAISIFLLMALGALLYHTNMGRELIPPPPLPVRPVEARQGIEPKVCVAFQPETNAWGYQRGLCPDHYAFMANSDVGGGQKDGPGEFVELSGVCCPLPSSDILSDRHVYSEFENCPDQFIATGGAGDCTEGCSMRCTQINTKRYKLGPERSSFYVRKRDLNQRLFGGGSAVRIFWDQLPESIRFAVLRRSHNSWDKDDCVGNPIGSLLTRKSGKRCDQFFYRELQYLDGTPVQILPHCEVLADPYASSPECLPANQRHRAVQVMEKTR